MNISKESLEKELGVKLNNTKLINSSFIYQYDFQNKIFIPELSSRQIGRLTIRYLKYLNYNYENKEKLFFKNKLQISVVNHQKLDNISFNYPEIEHDLQLNDKNPAL